MDNRYGDVILYWNDFKPVLDEFALEVAAKRYDKMDYNMWRRMSKSRPGKDEVVISWDCEGVRICLPEEDECHFFCWDSGFAKYLWNDWIEYNWSYWGEYTDVYGVNHTIRAGDVKVQCTSSNEYPVKNYKINFADIESTKNIAIDCGEALKHSLAITKEKLADIGIMPITADAGPSISCAIDTKVDKAEFDKRLDDLTAKVENVLNKYENKKESSTMKGFNFDFGPMNGNVVRMSMYGMAVKNKVGTWVSYDAKAGEIMDVDVFNFDGSKFMYKMPVAIKDVAVGDVIVHMSVPMFVIGKSEDGKAVIAVDPVAGERKEIVLTKSPFGFNFITKVVNFLGDAFSSADASNPFGNLGLMMMMSEGGDMKDMLPLMLMANGGNMDMSNPMVMYALMSGDGKMGDMLPFMLMMNANKPVAHNCHCGEHHE